MCDDKKQLLKLISDNYGLITKDDYLDIINKYCLGFQGLDYWNTLPNDIFDLICKFLDLKHYYKFSVLNKKTYLLSAKYTRFNLEKSPNQPKNHSSIRVSKNIKNIFLSNSTEKIQNLLTNPYISVD